MKNLKLFFLSALMLLNAGMMNAAWSGSGWGTQQGGIWYALYSTSEANFSTISSKEYTISAPGASLSYDAKCVPILGIYSGDLKVAQYINGSYSDAIYSKQPPKNSYQNYSGIGLNVAATKVKLYTEFGATGYKYFKNVFVTMAQYMEDASKSSLNFGDKKVQDAAASDNFTIAHCNIPAMTYAVNNNGGDEVTLQDVEVSISDNSQAGYYSTATITVKYTPNHAGTLNANLVITSAGIGSKTISLSGSCTKRDQVITWREIGRVLIGDTLANVASTDPGVELTFASSSSSTIAVVDGKLVAKKIGSARITASNDGSDYYNPISDQKQFDVSAVVRLDANGGVGGDTLVYAAYGAAMPAAVAPTRENHTFDGYFDASGVRYYNADMSSANDWDQLGNGILYAHWIHDSYSIVWLSEDGSVIDTTAVAPDSIPTHAPLTKDDTERYTYNFKGWGTLVPASCDTTYRSLGFDSTAVEYHIFYSDSLGVGDNPNPMTYTCESAITLQNLEWNGYNFLGWFDAENNKVTEIALGTTGDIELNAKWEVGQPSAVEEIGDKKVTKILRNGHVLIIRDGRTFDLNGHLIH